MTKPERTVGQRIWLEAPPDTQRINQIKSHPKNSRSANFGLLATCTDVHQGTYLVSNDEGNEWLIAQGADGVFDIVSKPPDRGERLPTDNRIIAAVKGYIKRNARQD